MAQKLELSTHSNEGVRLKMVQQTEWEGVACDGLAFHPRRERGGNTPSGLMLQELHTVKLPGLSVSQ